MSMPQRHALCSAASACALLLAAGLLGARFDEAAVAAAPAAVAVTPAAQPSEEWERSQITRLVVEERDAHDLGLWDRMRAAFYPDSRVEVWFKGSGAEFVEASKKSYDAGNRPIHLMGPVDVTVNASRALAQYNTLIRAHQQLAGVEVVSNVSVRVYERLEKRDGLWRISYLTVVYQMSEMAPVNPWDHLTVDKKLVESLRPSYRYVAYNLAARGVRVPDDLLGIDRPGPVQKMIDANEAWLHGG